MSEYLTTFSCTIDAAPQAKGNSRQFGRIWGGKRISRKSDKAQAFMDYAVARIRLAANGQTFNPRSELSLWCDIGYPTRHSDLDESLVMDALEKAGVIDNDVQIGRKTVSRARPVGAFVNLEVEDIGPLPWKRKLEGHLENPLYGRLADGPE